MIIGVTSASKAHGVSSIAAGLASALGHDSSEVLLIEADIAGGDLAAIRGFDPSNRGVLSFAAQSGMETSGSALGFGLETDGSALGFGMETDGSENKTSLNPLERHLWRSPKSNVALLASTEGGPALRTQIEALIRDGGTVLSAWPGYVVLDLGRWGDEVSASIWASCDVGVVIANGSLAQLRRCETLWQQSPYTNTFATWRVLNGSSWTKTEIETATGLGFDTVLDWDTKAVENYLIGDWDGSKRRHLSRQLIDLAASIVDTHPLNIETTTESLSRPTTSTVQSPSEPTVSVASGSEVGQL